jgi:hypothetical protein
MAKVHRKCGGEVSQFGQWTTGKTRYICDRCGEYVEEKDTDMIKDEEGDG